MFVRANHGHSFEISAHARYVGQWKKNKFHGIGTLSYADGGEYSGEWRNDRKHGHGRMCFANADVYEGDWKNGVMHGCV